LHARAQPTLVGPEVTDAFEGNWTATLMLVQLPLLLLYLWLAEAPQPTVPLGSD